MTTQYGSGFTRTPGFQTMWNVPRASSFCHARPKVSVIVAGVDANAPLWRIEFGIAQRRQQPFGIVGAGASERAGGEMHLKIGCFGAGGYWSVRAVTKLVCADEAARRGRGKRLKKRCGRDVAFRGLGRHLRDLGFARRQAGNRHLVRIEAGAPVSLVEDGRRLADDRREHHVRLQAGDFADRLVEIFRLGVERHVQLVQNLALGLGDEIGHHPIGFVRIYVIRSDQHKPVAVMLQ